jgi:hypothetical protein
LSAKKATEKGCDLYRRRIPGAMFAEEFFIGLEMKGHERGLLGVGLSLLKPVDLAGIRE